MESLVGHSDLQPSTLPAERRSSSVGFCNGTSARIAEAPESDAAPARSGLAPAPPRSLPRAPALDLHEPGPCVFCRDTGLRFNWFLTDGKWEQVEEACSCRVAA